MSRVPLPARQAIPVAFGALTLTSVGVLLACDAIPHLSPARTHDFFAALPLVLIAATHVVYQAGRRGPAVEWAKTTLLALAFLFWAANLLCADPRLASLFNDIAISAFVLDGLLILFGGRPSPSPDKAKPEAS